MTAALREHRRARPRHARRLRAPRRLRAAAQGARHDAARTSLAELQASGLRGRGGAGFAMGKKASFMPKGDDGQVPRLQRRRVRARHVQGPRADAEEPAHAHRGHDHRGLRGRAPTSAFIYIRGEYEQQADILDAAVAEARERRLPRRAHPRLRLHARPRRAPRRGRLHLRRGDRAARLARGQARQPAPEAAVPRQPGPLPGADADQQRRDAGDRPAHHRAWAARSTRKIGAETSTGTKLVSVSGNVQRPGNYEIELGMSLARASSTASPAARPRGARSSSGSPAARASPVLHRQRRPRPPLRLRHDGQGRLDARLRRDHRRRRLEPGRRRRAEAGEVLPPRVVRQVHAVPRGHELDGEDARAHRRRRGHPDGPRHHGLGPGADHRQLPVRARRRDGDADRLDDRASSATSSRRTSSSPASARPRRRHPAGQPRPPGRTGPDARARGADPTPAEA